MVELVALFNLWLAGVIVEASGRAFRPWPKLDAIDLPNAFFFAFTASLLASFLPGVAGLLATGFAGALHDPVAALVFCAPSQVSLNVINGKVVVREGRLTTLELPPLLERHNRLARSLGEAARTA